VIKDPPYGKCDSEYYGVNLYDRKILYEVLCERGEYSSEHFDACLQMLNDGEPLAYILGEWYFYGETFYINRGCLIPRSDTEHIVDKLIEKLPTGSKFLELCCGSGCIALSALKNRTDVSAVMTDVSDDAASASLRNADNLGVSDRCRIIQADLFDLELAKQILADDKYDVIVSNPPYIKTDVIETLDENVKREPVSALDGGKDGLDFYRFITAEYKMFLKNSGMIIYEIGYDQAEEIKEIAALNSFKCEIFRDYGGNDRVAILKTV